MKVLNISSRFQKFLIYLLEFRNCSNYWEILCISSEKCTQYAFSFFTSFPIHFLFFSLSMLPSNCISKLMKKKKKQYFRIIYFYKNSSFSGDFSIFRNMWRFTCIKARFYYYKIVTKTDFPNENNKDTGHVN